GNAPPPDPSRQRVTGDGKAVVTTRERQQVYRYVPPAPQTYLAPPPLVADLGRKRRILVREASGKYLLSSPDGKEVRTFIERPYERHMVHVVPAGAGPVVVAYDGKTGKQLWVRDHYSFYGKNPVQFAAHLPTAVCDYDGDEADDWIVCSENFYGIISVKDNRDLVGPVVLSDTIPGHWTAYTYPSLGDPLGSGKQALFHHQAYSLVLLTDLQGRPLWHYGLTRDTGGAWGLLADLDGDGKQEALSVQPDGLIRCFAPEAAGERCPRCPPEAMLTEANHAGRPRWELDRKGPVSRLIGADLDGDGRWEVLFGDRHGLHALA